MDLGGLKARAGSRKQTEACGRSKHAPFWGWAGEKSMGAWTIVLGKGAPGNSDRGKREAGRQGGAAAHCHCGPAGCFCQTRRSQSIRRCHCLRRGLFQRSVADLSQIQPRRQRRRLQVLPVFAVSAPTGIFCCHISPGLGAGPSTSLDYTLMRNCLLK